MFGVLANNSIVVRSPIYFKSYLGTTIKFLPVQLLKILFNDFAMLVE